jgi:predicted transcriptional regulator
MGKIVTIYLSDQEARDLKEFCEENRCTQYSALKTAVKQLLFEPINRKEEDIPEEFMEETEEDDTAHDEVAEELDETTVPEPDPLTFLIKRLRARIDGARDILNIKRAQKLFI